MTGRTPRTHFWHVRVNPQTLRMDEHIIIIPWVAEQYTHCHQWALIAHLHSRSRPFLLGEVINLLILWKFQLSKSLLSIHCHGHGESCKHLEGTCPVSRLFHIPLWSTKLDYLVINTPFMLSGGELRVNLLFFFFCNKTWQWLYELCLFFFLLSGDAHCRENMELLRFLWLRVLAFKVAQLPQAFSGYWRTATGTLGILKQPLTFHVDIEYMD